MRKNKKQRKHLHPIMFLLNPVVPSLSPADGWSFTSHYVPIKLYIPHDHTRQSRFTSHYVPIKSKTKTEVKVDVKQFTSHYVPIKS